MFGFLKYKPVLSEQDAAFQFETYKWLLKYFGGESFYEGARLVLPTRDFFPSKVESPEEAAVETFNTVKHYAGMEGWPCQLVAQEEDVDPAVGGALLVQGAPYSALGSFEYQSEDSVIITLTLALFRTPLCWWPLLPMSFLII